MIGITARITVQEGKEEEFAAICSELQQQVTTNEDQCEFYKFFKTANAQEFIALECYHNEDALAAHGQSEYFKRLGKAMGPLLAGAPVIEKYTAV